MTIWGNHSVTQVPDLAHATVAGRPATELVDAAWVADDFIPTVQKRGATVIAARGASSAASAANAAIDQMRDWVLGTPADDWVSMAIPSDGHYGVGAGLMYSFPVTVRGGRVEVVPGLAIDDGIRARMKASEQELLEERDAVGHLLG
jgi:malate dehydrogenase